VKLATSASGRFGLAVDDVHAANGEQTLPLGAELLVVAEHEVDELASVDEPQVLAGTPQVDGVLGVAS